MVGYFFTWTAYGCWLQGDSRGWVQDGAEFPGNTCIRFSNLKNMKNMAISFTTEQQKIIYDSILVHAEEKKYEIFALAVVKSHVHLIIERTQESPGRLAARFKNCAGRAIKDDFGGKKIWTKGFYNKYCNNNRQLFEVVEYVKGHGRLTPFVYVS